MAYIATAGTRASELSERSGQHKQVIGTLIDELERLGYVTRRPDPADRRAKLVVPTEAGRDQMAQARRIISDIETRLAGLVGQERFAAFKSVFEEITRGYKPITMSSRCALRNSLSVSHPGTSSRVCPVSRRGRMCVSNSV
jgi:DNA-binding MarR family transcriptional regulator